MERRIFYSMCVMVALAVLLSAPLAPWRVTTGLLLGGGLSLLNHHWLRTSIAAAFEVTEPGRKPKLKIARFILRYLIVAALLTAAHTLNIASLTAALVGLCSFALAAMLEAFIQIYFIIAHREGLE